jgi:hypothetical protein
MTLPVDSAPHCERDKITEDCEIEITPAMVAAGYHEYSIRWCGLRDVEEDVEHEMIVELYKAMFRLRPQSAREVQ